MNAENWASLAYGESKGKWTRLYIVKPEFDDIAIDAWCTELNLRLLNVRADKRNVHIDLFDVLMMYGGKRFAILWFNYTANATLFKLTFV